jgi:predicted O-methyltransferase YrrM
MKHTDLFKMNGNYLPCYVPEHGEMGQGLFGGDYYPEYFKIYKKFAKNKKSLKMLEFGTFTGYQIPVFAKATENIPSVYIGIDVGEYHSAGLELAQGTALRCKNHYNNFDYSIIHGNTQDKDIQRTICLSSPYDIIHIDGDHSYFGKCNDLKLASQCIADDGIVLVDDYDHIPDTIRPAIKFAIENNWFVKMDCVKTLRGMAILYKTNAKDNILKEKNE